MTYATDSILAPLHGAMPHRLAARHAAAGAHRRTAWPAPGSKSRSTTGPIDAPERDDDPLLRRAARQLAPISPARATPSTCRSTCRARAFQRAVWQALLRIARRRDAQLRRDRARPRPAVGEPRGRRGGRPQSGLDHRALPSRRRQHGALTGYAGGLDARPRCCASRPIARAAGARRAPAGASLRPRDVAELVALAALWGALVPVHARRRAGVRPVRARLPARRRRRARCSCRCSRCAASSRALRRHWRPIAVVGFVNSALPFLCFAYAALTINAGLVGDLQLGDAAVRRDGRLALARRPHDAAARRSASAIGFAGVLWIGWDKADFRPGRLGAGRSAPACSRRCRTASRRASPSAPGRRAAARRRRRQPGRGGALSRRAGGAGVAGAAPSAHAWLMVALLAVLRHRPRLRPLLPPDRQRRAGERGRRDLPDPDLRRRLGRRLPRRAADAAAGRRLRRHLHRHGARDRHLGPPDDRRARAAAADA